MQWMVWPVNRLITKVSRMSIITTAYWHAYTPMILRRLSTTKKESIAWCSVILAYGLSLMWVMSTMIARFMGPTWGPSGADRTQVGPMLAPWTLLSGYGSSKPQCLSWEDPDEYYPFYWYYERQRRSYVRRRLLRGNMLIVRMTDMFLRENHHASVVWN